MLSLLIVKNLIKTCGGSKMERSSSLMTTTTIGAWESSPLPRHPQPTLLMKRQETIIIFKIAPLPPPTTSTSNSISMSRRASSAKEAMETNTSTNSLNSSQIFAGWTSSITDSSAISQFSTMETTATMETTMMKTPTESFGASQFHTE